MSRPPALDLVALREVRERLRALAQGGVGLLLVTHHLDDIIPEIDPRRFDSPRPSVRRWTEGEDPNFGALNRGCMAWGLR